MREGYLGAPINVDSPFLSELDKAARFETVYDRILDALDISTQLELIEILQISQASFNDAKRRGVIPAWWLVRLLMNYRLSPQWILSGEGPRAYGADALRDPDEVNYLMSFVSPLVQKR